MKYIITSLLLTTGLLTAAEPPEAIRAYYERAAFLATYSTPQERTAKYSFPTQGARQGRIAEAQKLNAQMILQSDPRMPLGRQMTTSTQGYIALSEIVECDATSTRITLKVRSHQLASTAVARFCALFDQVAGDPAKLPTLDQQLAMTSAKVSPVVIHQWVQTPDGWRKQESDWLLLSR
jgi:hypothetical protein